MASKQSSRSGAGRPPIEELKNLLYNPNFSSDPDRSLAILNEISGRAKRLKHADIDRLEDGEAAVLASRLREILRDRRGDIILRAKKRLLGG